MINTRSQTGNPIRNDRPSCPPTTDPGLIPETRRETLSERSHRLSSDNRHWINTRSTTGKLSTFCQPSSPQSNQDEDSFLTLSHYRQQLQSLAYDSVALDGILSPSPTTYRHLSAFRMLHIWLKTNTNQ